MIKNKITKSKIKIPKEIVEKLEKLQNKQGRNISFEPWEDEVILTYGEQKRLEEIADILGYSTTTLRRRRDELSKIRA